ncbi:MAG: hypothetical protein JO156_14475, partial [Solirubrobacterales bacterium]|nr:hypothetical protein [Solirubrobacterales bacterium]
ERFLSQPFHVAEQFTGTPGVYVKTEDSIRGFKEILEGKHDDLPERAFFMKGTIDQVVKDARGEEDDEDESKEREDEDESKDEESSDEREHESDDDDDEHSDDDDERSDEE